MKFRKRARKRGKFRLKTERDGHLVSLTITPTETTSRNALLKVTKTYTIGLMPMLTMAEPLMVIERVWNPFTLIWKGTERMVVFSWRNLVSIQKMFTGDVSVATLGGPIMIGKIAGESLSHGLISFLNLMAILIDRSWGFEYSPDSGFGWWSSSTARD